MRSMKDYFGSLFGKRKGAGGAKPSIEKGRAEIPRQERSAAPSHRRKVYEKGDIIGGRYEIYGTLGMGGFGLVYLAYNQDTKEVVALKTFRDEFLADGKAREAFKKEALLWVDLEEYPFILAARWVDEFSGRLFVSMDYIAPDQSKRVNLADYLEHAGGPIDTETALRWAIQFCYGMEHVNAHGIKCHRDIKPTNILITQDGTLRITDFGLAAAAQIAWGGGVSFLSSGKDGRPGYSLLATEGKRICGTPGYIPPETHRGEGADVRSDIYSFGLVLWQMASGSVSPPFHVYVPHRGSDEEYIRQYLEAVYHQQMTGKLPLVDSPMKSIIELCLVVEPSKRYADFTQLRDQLASVYYSLTRRTVEVPQIGEKTSAFWNNRGGCLRSLGRYDEAIDCFNKALEIDPRNAAPWTNKGNSLNSLGRYDEAIDCYNKASEIDPRNAAAWTNKGGNLRSLGRYDEAIDCYNKALEIDPRYADAWYNMGNSLYYLGRYDKAIDCYNKALEIDPRFAYAWNGKGLSLASLGRYDEAIDCYNKVLEIDPRYADAWYNKGINLSSLGRYDESIDCCNKALEIDPRDAKAWYNKALAEETLDRTKETVKSYRKFIECAPAQYAEQIAHARQRIKELE